MRGRLLLRGREWVREGGGGGDGIWDGCISVVSGAKGFGRCIAGLLVAGTSGKGGGFCEIC